MKPSIWKNSLIAFVCFLLAVASVALWAIAPIFTKIEPISSTKILAADGSLLYEINHPTNGNSTVLAYEDFPNHLVEALIATEDKRFYKHRGTDTYALVRSLVESIRTKSIASGGSTLEMQLVKNKYFPNAPRSFVQKFRELIAAEYWALTHTKEETIQIYLNTIALGNNTSGVQAAAQQYFKKDINDITRAESALLVGIMNAPTRLNPYTKRAAAITRRNWVLKKLLEQQKISEAEYQESVEEEPIIWAPIHPIQAPHFVQSIIDEWEEKLPDLRTAGYTIQTTLDPNLQRMTEQIIQKRLSELSTKNVQNAAVVLIQPQTGNVLAYVGSADFWDQSIGGQIDMIATPRQPGSALKPFLVFQALRTFAATNTVLTDTPTRFAAGDEEESGYYPKNFTSKYHGPVLLREALGSSLNIPMVELLEKVGLRPFFGTLQTFGLTYPNPPEVYGKSVILGGAESQLIEVTNAYARLALGAKKVTTQKVTGIRNAKGEWVYQVSYAPQTGLYSANTTDNHIAEQAAYLTSHILRDDQARELAFGEANRMENRGAFAIKSGTTKDFRDNLAFAYNQNLAIGVWVGNTDNSPMQGITGVTGSVPILHDIILRSTIPASDWPMPDGITTKTICLPSGLLKTNICPKYRDELFRAGTEPIESDTWWTMKNGKPALSLPPEFAQIAATNQNDIQAHTTPLILHPKNGDAFKLTPGVPRETQTIPLTASIPNAVWTINEKIIQAHELTTLWTPAVGDYELSLQGNPETIHFTVR